MNDVFHRLLQENLRLRTFSKVIEGSNKTFSPRVGYVYRIRFQQTVIVRKTNPVFQFSKTLCHQTKGAGVRKGRIWTYPPIGLSFLDTYMLYSFWGKSIFLCKVLQFEHILSKNRKNPFFISSYDWHPIPWFLVVIDPFADLISVSIYATRIMKMKISIFVSTKKYVTAGHLHFEMANIYPFSASAT